MAGTQPEVKRTLCVIVGAGMTGIALADKIARSGVLERNEFVILDRNTDFGGVWESNTYPGVACNIPSHAYVVRAFLNPDWSKKFSEGKEIQQYYARYAAREHLENNTVFNTTVHQARWNEETLLWEVLAEDRTTGRQTKWISNLIFDSGGGFHRPKYPNIPGRETFKGQQWHTGEWRAGADLTGKRVAVIGTGPSAAQVGPAIQPMVDKLYMFQRSCGHVLPRQNHGIPTWKKLLFRWFYPLLWLYHVSWFVSFDRMRDQWMSGTKSNAALHQACIDFLEKEVKDPEVREKLRPTTEFGCKRVLFLDNWYSMYNYPNVELVTDKPVRITEHGIVSKPPHALSRKELEDEPVGAYEPKTQEIDVEELEREVDVIIWGTGYDMDDSGGHFQIYGKNGINLSQTWKDYPETYWGVSVTEFPNLFLTLGPNSTNYWSNLTTVVEIQVNYHVKMIKHIKCQLKRGPYALYPQPKIQKDYNDWLRDNRGNPSFLAAHCATYHKTPAGATPMYNHYRIWDYYWKMLRPTFKDYVEIRQPKLFDQTSSTS